MGNNHATLQISNILSYLFVIFPNIYLRMIIIPSSRYPISNILVLLHQTKYHIKFRFATLSISYILYNISHRKSDHSDHPPLPSHIQYYLLSLSSLDLQSFISSYLQITHISHTFIHTGASGAFGAPNIQIQIWYLPGSQ